MHESDELASAFVELETLVRNHSRLPGLAAAQAEARRRRINRVAWASAALVLVVVAGVFTIIDGRLLGNRPPVLQPSPSTSVTTSVTPSPSATASPTPSPSVTTPASVVLGDMAPPARIRNATLDVPAFDLNGCPSGRLQFADGQSGTEESGLVQIPSAAVGDVNADGTEDIVVSLRCVVPVELHGVSRIQVVAYSGSGLTLLGRMATGGDSTEAGSLLVRPNGEVEVSVAQRSFVGPVESITFHRYRWTGSGFAESAAPVTVNADGLPAVSVSPTPTTVQVTPRGPAQPVVLTIRNDGPASPGPLRLSVTTDGPVSLDIEEASSLVPESSLSVLIAPPEPGGTVTVTLLVTWPTDGGQSFGASILGDILGGRPSVSDPQRFTITVVPG